MVGFKMTVLVFVAVLRFSGHAQEMNYRRNMDMIFDESTYDDTLPPEKTTNVSIYLHIYNIHSVNEETMDFSSEMYVQQEWVDDRLNGSHWKQITDKDKLILIPRYIRRVWRPNVYFLQEKTAYIHDVPQSNQVMYIYRNGTIVYNMRMSMKHACHMSFTMYPFDSQKCTVTLMSYSYTDDLVNLNWAALGVDLLSSESQHFELHKHRPSKDVVQSKDGNFTRLSFQLSLFRRPYPYVFNLYIPSAFIIILSWISFWIDPAVVTGRLGLGSVCVLAMVSNHAGIQSTVPSAPYIKAIDYWIIACQFLVHSVLVQYGVVYHLYVFPARKKKKTSVTSAKSEKNCGTCGRSGQQHGKANEKCAKDSSKETASTSSDERTHL